MENSMEKAFRPCLMALREEDYGKMEKSRTGLKKAQTMEMAFCMIDVI